MQELDIDFDEFGRLVFKPKKEEKDLTDRDIVIVMSLHRHNKGAPCSVKQL